MTQATIQIVRHALLAIFVFAVVGLAAELLLLGHFDGFTQLVPLILIALCIPAIVWHLLKPQRASVMAIRIAAVLFMIGGAVGVYMHYRGNAIFELDIVPDIHGFELFWKSISGATPALAPGTLIQLGMIAWVYTFRHPLLPNASQSNPEQGKQ